MHLSGTLVTERDFNTLGWGRMQREVWHQGAGSSMSIRLHGPVINGIS